ncbi:P-loop NTPase fold protein [Rhizobium leguminosarum]|uniref:P-loop NTPase fold protein n=1 Tax=Rhizobium leguminosarum TaxID=384 RepID=UPI003F96CA29
MDPNEHVKSFLRYYVNFSKPPHYAVLLDGPWGIGKTFLVKQFMKPLIDAGTSCAYVSLYGLTSLAEIDHALFRAAYPLLDSKAARLAGEVLKTGARFFNVSTDMGAKDVLGRTRADVFIFDDLERCVAPVNSVLGYINHFVEHEDRKVIIIANEDEIDKSGDYTRVREKLIGKTLKLQSAFDEAMAEFLANAEYQMTRNVLQKHSVYIAELYHRAAFNNLRILQQSIWDFERVFLALSPKHREHEEAVKTLLGLLFVLSFEIKAGRLTAADIDQRQSRLFSAQMQGFQKADELPPISQAEARYPTVDVGSSLLSDETLISILTRGMVNETQINDDFSASSFFVTVADEEPWQTVWHAFERSESEFNVALARMEAAFADRLYNASGDVLHVFALRLWLSRIQVLHLGLETIVGECKAYVDDLLSSVRIEPLRRNAGYLDMRITGSGGLGFHDNETREFREVFEYFTEKRRAAERARFPELASSILADMKSDPAQFYRRLNVGQNAGDLYNIPVLAQIDPDEFVSSLLAMHPSHQRTALLALKERYAQGALQRDLLDEKPWAEEIRSRLNEVAESASPISRFVIRNNVGYSLNEVLASQSAAAILDETATQD